MNIRSLVSASLFALIWTVAATADDRPNLVFAIADDWGWPHAGAYGDTAVNTPNFDRIAREGVLFENAFVSSPSCTPCRGAIIAGQHFFRLQAGANLWCKWPTGQFAEFPQLLSEAGYHVGSWRKAWGPGTGRPGGKAYRNTDEFFAARKKGQPFCFWFGTSDPHRGYRLGSGAASGIDLSKVHLFPHFPDVDEVRSDIADYYFEVQRWDRDVGRLMERLKRMGELDRTLIVMTGDHGMPFPRCKGNVYDCGSRVPLAMRWPAQVPGGRRITDFVLLTDIAPTFLAAAGLSIPDEMTGHSLLPTLQSNQRGRVDAMRDHVIIGRERHVPSQELPDLGGYPMRALRTDDYLFIRNYRPDRWPAGTPYYEKANGTWLGDCDNGPTKTYLWTHRDEESVREKYALCFAKRPGEELYDLKNDPNQLHNVADNAAFADIKNQLARRLQSELVAAEDPRALGQGDEFFDQHEYLGGGPKWPFQKD